MTYSKKNKKQKSEIRGLLPVMGLLLAILFGIMAYFLTPALIDFGREQNADFDQMVRDFQRDNDELPEDTLTYVFAVILWLVFMAISMTLAAAAIGQDPEKLAFKDMPPAPSDKKAMIKQMRRDLKAAKKREREAKRRRN